MKIKLKKKKENNEAYIVRLFVKCSLFPWRL